MSRTALIDALNGTTPLHTALEKGYDVAVREIAARKKDKRYVQALA